MARSRSVKAAVAASLVLGGAGLVGLTAPSANAAITAPAKRGYLSIPTGSVFAPGEFPLNPADVDITAAQDSDLTVTLNPQTSPATAAFTLAIDPKTGGQFGITADGGATAAAATASVFGMNATQTGATCTNPTGEFSLAPGSAYGSPASTSSHFNKLAVQFRIDCAGGATPDASGFFYANQPLGPVVTSPATDIGEYEPLATPVRLLDTRSPASKLTAGGEKNIDTKLDSLGGNSGVPGTALAVVVNVTGVAPDMWTFLSLYPKGGSRPLVSNLNPRDKDTVANLATVKVGADDSITLYNEVGTTDAVIDVVGYYAPNNDANGAGDRFSPLASPARAYDSRDTGKTKLAEGETRTIDFTTLNPAIATEEAVLVNVTAIAPTKGGYLTLFPENLTTVPTASNINFTTDQTVANLAIVTLNQGKIKVYNPAGTTHVAIDLIGTFSEDTLGSTNGAGRFVSIDPTRAYDSRSAGGTKIAEGASRDVNLVWLTDKYPFEYSSVVANMTVADTTAQSYMTAYPASETTAPNASNLNWLAGEVRPNQIVSGTDDDGYTSFYNAKGQTNLILDVAGFFTR